MAPDEVLTMGRLGVDDRFVTPVGGLPTPITFCESFPPDHFPLWFYRCPKAPDLEMHVRNLDVAAIRGAGVFWVTGTGLSAEPSRSATLAGWDLEAAMRFAGVASRLSCSDAMPTEAEVRAAAAGASRRDDPGGEGPAGDE